MVYCVHSLESPRGDSNENTQNNSILKYSKVLAAIKLQSEVSSFFEISLGVKQGEPLSPLLFILFVNDICSDIVNVNENSSLKGVDINHICFFLLMFADDIVLFSKDPKELQTLLQKLHVYSSEWGLKVNTKKTKICVFENRKAARNQEWCYNGEKLEVVDWFCYLGMKFHYNGNLEPGVKALSDQALKAANNLLALFKRMSFDVRTKLKLFDSLVSPILLYGSEVWGIHEYDHVDKIHIKFCKSILGVRSQTTNYAVYGDLGRFPLSVIAKERAIKYWLKVISNQNSLMFRIFQAQIERIQTNGRLSRIRHKRYWASGIKCLLDSLGFSNFWNNQLYDVPHFFVIRNRIRDHFMQHWYVNICNSPKLGYYSQFKTEFKFEKYLDCITNDKLLKELAAFRLSAHNLDIELGRHSNVPREDRLCRLCPMQMVESEYHFLLVCPLYGDIRRQFLTRTAWPSVAKFLNIMSAQTNSFLKKLSKFIHAANITRSEALARLAAS